MLLAVVWIGKHADLSSGVAGSYKGRYSSWNSPRECHNDCVNGLSKFIDDGINAAYCRNCVNGVTVCC